MPNAAKNRPYRLRVYLLVCMYTTVCTVCTVCTPESDTGTTGTTAKIERYSSTTAVVDLHPHVCVYTPTGPTKFSTTTKFSISTHGTKFSTSLEVAYPVVPCSMVYTHSSSV